MNSLLPDPTASLLDRIKISMVGLKMPRAIEVVDTCVSRLDRGEITGLELVEQLLLEELTFREDRRIRTALRMGRLNTVKTLTGYDFSFQPSLDKARILALAELNFVARSNQDRPQAAPSDSPSKGQASGRVAAGARTSAPQGLARYIYGRSCGRSRPGGR
jgi:hypothetical protein